MWVICNKHSRTSGPCVTTMRWILNTRQIPGQLSVFTGQPPSLGNKNQVHLLSWAKDEWVCCERIAACKHCGTNATGTTTDTINTAVVPLTMSVAWHSGPVWICWKKKEQWCSLRLLSEPSSQGLQARAQRTWLAQLQVKDPRRVSRLCLSKPAGFRLLNSLWLNLYSCVFLLRQVILFLDSLRGCLFICKGES